MAEQTTTDSLTARQHGALLALLSEPTIGQAAQKAGVPDRTLHNWLRAPLFRDAYRAARRESVSVAIGRAQSESAGAVGELVRLCKNARAESVRLGAARAILELAIKSVELDELDARLAALEEKYAAKF